jgi:hypothetical protein
MRKAIFLEIFPSYSPNIYPAIVCSQFFQGNRVEERREIMLYPLNTTNSFLLSVMLWILNIPQKLRCPQCSSIHR